MSDEVTRQVIVELQAQVLQLRREYEAERAEVEATREERDAAREERDAARAEAEGLRADLLAHPPEHAARIAELQATIEILRKEHKNCEAEYVSQRDEIADMQRKAAHDQSIIEGLREALERTEKRYIEAKARQVPRALVGLLGAIRREAAAAEKMIL